MEETDTLKVGTYNVQGNGENVAKVLEALDIDVIAVNEAYEVTDNKFNS